MKSLFESELPIGVVPRLAAPMHAGENEPRHKPCTDYAMAVKAVGQSASSTFTMWEVRILHRRQRGRLTRVAINR